MKQSTLLDGKKFQITLRRLCQQLIETHQEFEDVVFIGIQPRGTFLAQRLQEEIYEMTQVKVKLGLLDITFYRDDFRQKGSGPIIANSTEIDFIVDGKKVVLMDDVLWTGRTIRSAMDAFQAFGRPTKIELLVLVDRRFSREIPIQPDFIGMQVDTIDSQRVSVEWEEVDDKDSIMLLTESND